MRRLIRLAWISALGTVLVHLIREAYYPNMPKDLALVYILCIGLMAGDLMSLNH